MPKIDARWCIVAWQFVSMNYPGYSFQCLLDFSMYFIGPTIPNGHKKKWWAKKTRQEGPIFQIDQSIQIIRFTEAHGFLLLLQQAALSELKSAKKKPQHFVWLQCFFKFFSQMYYVASEGGASTIPYFIYCSIIQFLAHWALQRSIRFSSLVYSFISLRKRVHTYNMNRGIGLKKDIMT